MTRVNPSPKVFRYAMTVKSIRPSRAGIARLLEMIVFAGSAPSPRYTRTSEHSVAHSGADPAACVSSISRTALSSSSNRRAVARDVSSSNTAPSSRVAFWNVGRYSPDSRSSVCAPCDRTVKLPMKVGDDSPAGAQRNWNRPSSMGQPSIAFYVNANPSL